MFFCEWMKMIGFCVFLRASIIEINPTEQIKRLHPEQFYRANQKIPANADTIAAEVRTPADVDGDVPFGALVLFFGAFVLDFGAFELCIPDFLFSGVGAFELLLLFLPSKILLFFLSFRENWTRLPFTFLDSVKTVTRSNIDTMENCLMYFIFDCLQIGWWKSWWCAQKLYLEKLWVCLVFIFD